jgi:hypothetical protein
MQYFIDKVHKLTFLNRKILQKVINKFLFITFYPFNFFIKFIEYNFELIVVDLTK